jgi:hypothetical protein
MIVNLVTKQQVVYTDFGLTKIHKKARTITIFFSLRFCMRKASSRGFGFTAIAILVLLMALSAFLTKAEATQVTQSSQGQQSVEGMN